MMRARGRGDASRGNRAGLRALVFATTAAMALGSVGCTNLQPTRTGFLDHYEQLTPTTDRRSWGFGRHHVEAALPKAGDLDGVDSFYIEPVKWLAREDDWLGPNEYRRKTVSGALDGALRAKLGALRPIVETPGPRTARVRAAVTDVYATRAIANLIVSSLAWIFVSNGGVAVEAEVVAPDGRRIAAVDGASMGGLIDYCGYYLWFSHSRIGARRIAGELEDALRGFEKSRVDSLPSRSLPQPPM